MSESAARPTTVAFYLPQFYPNPDNDSWYGVGFTEWRGVVQAKPLFAGHHQPHIPGELGFYDLRVREVREQQARLARQHGIDAFCYYHYWFDGHRPLRSVIDDVLADDDPGIPFCLAWANENWARHWDGGRHEVLLRQSYSREDNEAHGRFLLQAMSHPRYLRTGGRPVLVIYRIQAIPDVTATLAGWRRMWREAGLAEVEIVKVDSHQDFNDPAIYGADAAAQFFPHIAEPLPRLTLPDAHPGNAVYAYDDVVRSHLAARPPAWRRHECVVPGWDNTPRRGDGLSLVVHGSTPQRYGEWLAAVHDRTPADGLVFINAWNEWAEGAHLEPDLRSGRAYLEATARAVGAAVPEIPRWGADFRTEPVVEEKRMAALYLDAYEAQSRLRRQLSRLEATLERQIEIATREAREEAAQARAHAVELVHEIERLRAERDRGSRSAGPANAGS